jgi:hypothetical protein
MTFKEQSGSLKELKFNNAQVCYFLGQINILKELQKHRSTIDPSTERFIKDNFKILTGFLPFLRTDVHFGNPFDRIVINKYIREDKRNARLNFVTQIKYPPDNIAKNLYYNRANLPGQSVFYAGYGKLATALETKPVKGDLYTTTRWQQKAESRILHIPIFHNEQLVSSTSEFKNDWDQYKELLKQLDANVSKVVWALYGFITEVFTTPVNPNNKIEYIFSALFANHFLNDAAHGVDCLYYPSVPSGYISSNIALKPSILEKHFDLIEVTESICVGSKESGLRGWMSFRSGQVKNPSIKKNDLIWDNVLPDDEEVNKIIKEYSIEFT